MVLYNCKLSALKDFRLDDCIDYRIITLDLFETAESAAKDRMNVEEMKEFVRALSATSLTRSLKKVHVKESLYAAAEVQELFDANGFSVEVWGDENWPFTKEHHKEKDKDKHHH